MNILKCFLYLILTDTDSCCIQFLFLSKLQSQISENQARKLIFEIILLKLGHPSRHLSAKANILMAIF